MHDALTEQRFHVEYRRIYTRVAADSGHAIFSIRLRNEHPSRASVSRAHASRGSCEYGAGLVFLAWMRPPHTTSPEKARARDPCFAQVPLFDGCRPSL